MMLPHQLMLVARALVILQRAVNSARFFLRQRMNEKELQAFDALWSEGVEAKTIEEQRDATRKFNDLFRNRD